MIRFLAVICIMPSICHSGTWVQWRGGESLGRADSKNVPIHWSSTSNVQWKTRLPGDGFSSPVVSEKAVYVSAVTKEPHSNTQVQILRVVVCILLNSLIVVGLALLLTTGVSKSAQSIPLNRPISRIGIAAGGGIIAAIVLFGEQLFNFGAISKSHRLMFSAVICSPFLLVAAAILLPDKFRKTRRSVIVACLLAVLSGVAVLLAKYSEWRESLWKVPGPARSPARSVAA